MAALQVLRDKAGVFIAILIGVALLAFILTDLLGSGNSVFMNRDELAVIDGQSIKINDFQQLIDEYETFTKMNQQSMTLTEDQQNQIREQVWNQLVNQIAYGSVYEKAGIDVTADELLDMVVGNHISSTLRPMFTNQQTGMYDRSMAENFLRNKNSDYQAAFYWNFVEKNLKNERLNKKYSDLLNKSVVCTSAMTQFEQSKLDKDVDIEFVSIRYTAIPDSAVTVTEAEVKSYFDENKEKYRVEASRDIEYVSFPVKPTAEDQQETYKYVESLIADFGAEETDAYRFAQMNSDETVKETYLKASQLSSELEKFVQTATIGQVYGPYRVGDTYKLSRLVNIAQRPDSVKASHILIRENDQLADSLYQVALKSNAAAFHAMARQYSQDNGSAINGGDLDWFNDGVMVPEFNEACFTNPKGSVQKVESQFGVHIILIEDKGVPTTKYSIATIDKTVQYSSKTHQNVYSQAIQFASENRSAAAFNAAIDTLNLVKRYGSNIRSNAYTINNLRSAREIVKWAYEAEVGDISEVFEVNDEFILAVLVKAQEKGYADINDVRPNIARDLRNDKKAEKVADEVSGKSLEEIATAYNSKVESSSNANFSSNAILGAGVEPKLVGSVISSEVGGVKGAVKGNNAMYFYEVKNINGKEISEDDAKAAFTKLFSGLNYYAQAVITDVDIEDNRLNFY